MKKIIIPVILLTILLVGCSGDKKDNKDNGSKDRQEKTTTEMTTEEPQKLATPTPTPLPDDLSKVEHYEKGGSELGDVVEYEDGKVAKIKEYDHNNIDEEYQTTYYYEEDLLIKEETVSKPAEISVSLFIAVSNSLSIGSNFTTVDCEISFRIFCLHADYNTIIICNSRVAISSAYRRKIYAGCFSIKRNRVSRILN